MSCSSLMLYYVQKASILSETAGESLTTDQLVNDQDFREAVEFFNSNGRLEEEQARQILLKLWRMDPVRRKREADITCSICQDICKRGVKTPCCNAVACRSCATREMTSTRACYGCKKSGITTVMLKNDPSPWCIYSYLVF